MTWRDRIGVVGIVAVGAILVSAYLDSVGTGPSPEPEVRRDRTSIHAATVIDDVPLPATTPQGVGREGSVVSEPLPEESGPDRVAAETRSWNKAYNWLLTVDVRADWPAMPKRLRLFIEIPSDSSGARRCPAVLNASTGLYQADVRGSRQDLSQGSLVVSTFDAYTAMLLPLQVTDDMGPLGIGRAQLSSSQWDMRLLRIDAGSVVLGEPRSLGALVLESPASFDRFFLISTDAAKVSVQQSAFLARGETRVELVTCLDATEWTASAMELETGPKVSEWSASAPVGQDILVPKAVAPGVHVALGQRICREVYAYSILRLPAPERRLISVEGLREGAEPAEQPFYTVLGESGCLHADLMPGPIFVPPGSYMIELWGPPDKGGSLHLAKAEPVTVRDDVVDILVD